AAGLGGVVMVWDVATRQLRGALRGHPGKIWSLAFTADSKTLVSGGEGGIVKIWDAATGKERATIVAESDNVRFLAIAPDGRPLATVCHERGPHRVLTLSD